MTDAAIAAISQHSEGIIFMFWGKFAQSKEKLVNVNK